MLERGAETVAAIKAGEHRDIPLVVLSSSGGGVEVLRGLGVDVGLTLSRPSELKRFQELLARGGDSSVTVVELS
jgi:hypothetical protein